MEEILQNKKLKYHFIGMCGKAMGTLAVMLQSMGHIVTGSDEGFYDPMLSYLRDHNINFTTGHSAGNIPHDVDFIVIGKHAKLVSETNLEAAEAFSNYKDKIKSLPEIMNTLTQGKDNIVCVGSFGKSSITTLTSFVLEHTGVNPSYFIGAVPIDLADSGKLTNSDVFVLEGDEYPSSNWDESAKFLHYNPTNIILSSCEHDHINVYPTLESYLQPFIELLKIIPEDGTLVYAYNGANIDKILDNANCIKVSYGIDSNATYYAQNINYGEITTFDLYKNKELVINLETILLGQHSIENIIGVSAMLLEKNLVSPSQLQNAIKVFHGVKGRLDKKISNSDIPIIESYGSSYAKAMADIEAVKLHYKGKKIIDIFEPHTFGWRNRGNLAWYTDIFKGLDSVYIFNPPTHGATADQLTIDEMVEEIKKTNPNVYPVTNKEEVYGLLKRDLNTDSLILLTTSGALDGLPEDLPKEIGNL